MSVCHGTSFWTVNGTPFSIIEMRTLRAKGLGVALIPMPISHAWFSSGALVKLFEQDLLSRDRYYLVQHNEDPERPEIKLLIDWVLQSFNTPEVALQPAS